MAKVGRKAAFETGRGKVEALKNVEALSRYHKAQLVEQGLLEIFKIENAGKGRKRYGFKMTGKAKGLMALAAKWKTA